MAADADSWSARLGDPMTLREAAGVVADVDPYLHVTGRDPERLRADVSRRNQREAQLIAAVEADPQELRCIVKRRNTKARYGRDLVRDRWDDPPSKLLEPAKSDVDPNASMVARTDLKAWCDTHGFRPRLWYPADAAPGRVEVGNVSVQDRLRIMAQAYSLFWAPFDADRHAEPKTPDVVAWLKGRGFTSGNLAQHAAAVIRPPTASKGGRKRKDLDA